MKEQLLICELYDYYKELLTEKQRKYFEEYYFDNLSLAELSENYDISRNAIHKTIKEVLDKLNHYESCLKLKLKKDNIKKLISTLDDKLQEKIIENL